MGPEVSPGVHVGEAVSVFLWPSAAFLSSSVGREDVVPGFGGSATQVQLPEEPAPAFQVDRCWEAGAADT